MTIVAIEDTYDDPEEGDGLYPCQRCGEPTWYQPCTRCEAEKVPHVDDGMVSDDRMG